mgnify:CR=1 FL=1
MTDYEHHSLDNDDANVRWSHVAELIQLATVAEENLAENDIEGGGTYASKSPKTILSAFLEGVSLLSSSEATHGDEMFDDEEDESDEDEWEEEWGGRWNEREEETEEDLSTLSSQLSDLCKENKIEDVSNNEEHLLTFGLFPNIALRFFKNLLKK